MYINIYRRSGDVLGGQLAAAQDHLAAQGIMYEFKLILLSNLETISLFPLTDKLFLARQSSFSPVYLNLYRPNAVC
jgi:hypothetical protein